MPIDYRYLDSLTLKRLPLDKTIAVIPVGSLEQHCDSPLGLDALIAEKIAWASCEKLEEKNKASCIVLPTIYYGFSIEWSLAPGTITLKPETLIAMIREIAESLARSGFNKIAVVNGHASNSCLVRAALSEVSVEFGVKTIAIDYWRAGGVSLDHGGSVERSIASSLGIPVGSGECKRVESLDVISVDSLREPVVLDKGGVSSSTLDYIIESVARAMERLLED